jgi:exportin-7
MLGYLATKGPTLENFVINFFIKLLCRVTKLGWFDEGDVMRQLVQETTKFLEASPAPLHPLRRFR